jgi:methionine synthase I (cobalamin-dependent)
MGIPAPQSRAREFRQLLDSQVLVADGAMATMLFSKGIAQNRCLEELNLSLPAIVRDVHREYMRAGAKILETNTFGANRVRLGAFNFAGSVARINQAGVRIARETTAGAAYVAGAVGPLGVTLAPLGDMAVEQAREIFGEQIRALVGAGVDLLIFETFQDLDELRAAVETGREIAGPEMVLVAEISVSEDGTLPGGASAANAARHMAGMPADVIGVNCGSGPKSVIDAIEAMATAVETPLSAMPAAGIPSMTAAGLVFPASPHYLGECAKLLVQAGARIVGGCCGTTPDHIAEMRQSIEGLTASPRTVANASGIDPEPKTANPPPVAKRSGLGAKLAKRKFAVLVEILPPRSLGESPELGWAEKWGGVAVVPAAPSPRLEAAAACQLFAKQAGIETVLAPSLNGRVASVRSTLLSAYASGVRNVLCPGSNPAAIRIANELNHSGDLGGGALLVGVEGDAPVDGCDYLVTAPAFDSAALDKLKGLGVPVIVSIRPLLSVRDAEYVANEMGLPVPAAVVQRLKEATTPELARATGVAIAREIAEKARSVAAGVRLLAASGDSSLAIEVAQAIG